MKTAMEKKHRELMIAKTKKKVAEMMMDETQNTTHSIAEMFESVNNINAKFTNHPILYEVERQISVGFYLRSSSLKHVNTWKSTRRKECIIAEFKVSKKAAQEIHHEQREEIHFIRRWLHARTRIEKWHEKRFEIARELVGGIARAIINFIKTRRRV